jgi:hypothetical protein
LWCFNSGTLLTSSLHCSRLSLHWISCSVLYFLIHSRFCSLAYLKNIVESLYCMYFMWKSYETVNVLYISLHNQTALKLSLKSKKELDVPQFLVLIFGHILMLMKPLWAVKRQTNGRIFYIVNSLKLCNSNLLPLPAVPQWRKEKKQNTKFLSCHALFNQKFRDQPTRKYYIISVDFSWDEWHHGLSDFIPPPPHCNFVLFMRTKVWNYLMRIITEAEIFLRNVPFFGNFAKERNYPFTQ